MWRKVWLGSLQQPSTKGLSTRKPDTDGDWGNSRNNPEWKGAWWVLPHSTRAVKITAWVRCRIRQWQQWQNTTTPKIHRQEALSNDEECSETDMYSVNTAIHCKYQRGAWTVAKTDRRLKKSTIAWSEGMHPWIWCSTSVAICVRWNILVGLWQSENYPPSSALNQWWTTGPAHSSHGNNHEYCL